VPPLLSTVNSLLTLRDPRLPKETLHRGYAVRHSDGLLKMNGVPMFDEAYEIKGTSPSKENSAVNLMAAFSGFIQ